jgi:hypothetical protein
VTAARYVIAFAEQSLEALGGSGALAERITEFLARSEARVRREVSGVGKIVDVRSFVRTMAIGDETSLEALGRAGIVGRVVPLDVTISISPNGSAKVTEVVEALLGAPHDHLGVRVALVAGSGTPLDLLPHRRVRAVASADPPAAAH